MIVVFFSDEAFALKAAVSNIQAGKKTIILTDSASCIDALKKGWSKHPWIQSIEKMIENQDITFSWVPGHSGIRGNDKADEAAKQGRNETKLDIPLPAQDVLRSMRNKIWEVWQTEWHRTQVHLRQIKTSPCKYPDRKCPSEQRVLSRMRIGHTRITHVYLMTNSPPPMCNFCGVQLTVQHFLVECRGFEQNRKRCGINGSTAEILAYNTARETLLIKFLKDCNLFNEI